MNFSSYSILDRLVRISTFHFGVYNYGYFERIVMAVYRFFARSKWNRSFSLERVARSHNQLSKLGEEFDTSSGVNGMLFSAKKLALLIEEKGGKWGKISCDDGKTLMAIEEPQTSTWNEWANEVLAPLGWTRETVLIDGCEKRVIVTCADAKTIKEESMCFLWSHSPAMTFAFGKKRIGFYLGMRQDLCAYDPRGWGRSEGSPTEASLYEDIEAVYDFLTQSQGYQPEHIWAMGQCLGAAVATYLKSQHTEINLIVEQSFLMLRDIFDKLPSFIRWITGNHLNAMQRGGIESESLFDVSALLTSKNKGSGKVIIAGAKGDQMVPENIVDQWEVKARSISCDVTKIMFQASYQKDPHLECATHDLNLRSSYIQAIFSNGGNS